MPNLEDILNNQQTNLNLVVKPRVSTITQEELDAYRDGIDAALESGLVNKEGFTMLGEFSQSTKDASLNNNDYLSKLFTVPNRVEQFNNALNQAIEPEVELDSRKDVVLDTDKSELLARYDFPLYADTEDLAEQQAFNEQTNMQAIWKGAKNIVPVAIGIGAEMLGGMGQMANEQLFGDDDSSNWLIDWGDNFMKKYVSPVYQNPDGETFASPKSAIAAGADIIGQFGSAVGSMVAMSPVNAGIVRTTTSVGSMFGPIGAGVGALIGVVGAAALNAYADGVIEAADVFDQKKAELLKDTNNYAFSQETAKLAASTTATQNMLLNTALNVIPVLWSVKPYGIDKAVKKSLNLHDTNLSWFRLQKPYVPTQLAGETAEQLTERLAKIASNNFANNAKYSMINNPWEALKNIRGYGSQKLSGLKYNVQNPFEFLRRNWDIVGETFGEGLEEYHNYFARQQGMNVYKKEDASKIPSIPKLMQGYNDLVMHGEGAHDLVAGSIIGGMSAPIFSSIRFGRSKVYNPDTGEMEFKYQRHKMFNFIPWELNRDFEQKDYESTITNSLMMLKDAKELAHAYINTSDENEKELLLNRMLVAPITHYVDNNMLEIYKLSLDVFKDNINNGILHGDESILKNYMNTVQKKQFEEASNARIAELAKGSSANMTNINQYNVSIKQLLDDAKKEGSNHVRKIDKKIEFVKETSEQYKKVKESIETTYGGIDYGYANALFKNKVAMDMEEDIFKRVSDNRNTAYMNLKNAIFKDDPSLTEDQLVVKLSEELQDNNSIYQTQKDEYIKAQARFYESLLRKTKFSQRYNSLNSWGYENDKDLLEEMTLLESLGMMSFTENELIQLGINDNVNEVRKLNSMLEVLKSNSTPTQEEKDMINIIESMLGQTNDGINKLNSLHELVERLKTVQAKQVSNQKNFKNDSKTFKDFNPLLKYIKRNKIFTEEAKKLSKSKRDIELVNAALEAYKEYADVYADYLTEGDKKTIFEDGVDQLEKMKYAKMLTMDSTTKNRLEDWLKEHDDIHGRTIAKLLLIIQDNPDNKNIESYIKRMIEMMNYQKDVVDQLKTLNTVKDIKSALTYDSIIQSLNAGIITPQEAINNINEIISNEDFKKPIINAINDLISNEETILPYDFRTTYSYDDKNSIEYFTDGNSIFMLNGVSRKFSHNNGKIIHKTESIYLNTNDNTEHDDLELQEINGDNIVSLIINKPIEFYLDENVLNLMNRFEDTIKDNNVFTKDLFLQVFTIKDKLKAEIDNKIDLLELVFEEFSNEPEISTEIFNMFKTILNLYNNKEIYKDYFINDIEILNITPQDLNNLIDAILEGRTDLIKSTNKSLVSIDNTDKILVNKAIIDNNLLKIENNIVTIITISDYSDSKKLLLKNALINNDFSKIDFSYEKVIIDLNDKTFNVFTYMFNNKGKLFNESSFSHPESIINLNSGYINFQIWLNIDAFKEELNDKEVLKKEIKDKIQNIDISKNVEDFTYFDMKNNDQRMLFIENKLLNDDYYNPILFFYYISRNNKGKGNSEYFERIYRLLNSKYLKEENNEFIRLFDVTTNLIHEFEIQSRTELSTGWKEDGNNFYMINGDLYVKLENNKLFKIKKGGGVIPINNSKSLRDPLDKSPKQLLNISDENKTKIISVINHLKTKINNTSLVFPPTVNIDFDNVDETPINVDEIYEINNDRTSITISNNNIEIESVKSIGEETVPLAYMYNKKTFNPWWSFANEFLKVSQKGVIKGEGLVDELKKAAISKTKEELFPIGSFHKGKESGDILKVIGYTTEGVRFEIQTSGKVKPTKNLIFSELKRLINEGKLFPYNELESKKADIERRRQLSLSSKEESYEGGLGVALKATVIDKNGNKSSIQLSGDKDDPNKFEELDKRINDMYDMQYLTEISDKTMTEEEVLQALKKAGRENSDVYKHLSEVLKKSEKPAFVNQSNVNIELLKDNIDGSLEIDETEDLFDNTNGFEIYFHKREKDDFESKSYNYPITKFEEDYEEDYTERNLGVDDQKLYSDYYEAIQQALEDVETFYINEIKELVKDKLITEQEAFDFMDNYSNSEFEQFDFKNSDYYKELYKKFATPAKGTLDIITTEVKQRIELFEKIINSTPINYDEDTVYYKVKDNKLFTFYKEGTEDEAIKVDLDKFFTKSRNGLFEGFDKIQRYIDLNELFSNEKYMFWVIKILGIKKQQVNIKNAYVYFLNDYLTSRIIAAYNNNNPKLRRELYDKYVTGVLNSGKTIHLWRSLKEGDIGYIDENTFSYSSNAPGFSGRNKLRIYEKNNEKLIKVQRNGVSNQSLISLDKEELLNLILSGNAFIYVDNINDAEHTQKNENKTPFKALGQSIEYNGNQYYVYSMESGNTLIFIKTNDGYYLVNSDIIANEKNLFSPEIKYAFNSGNTLNKRPYVVIPFIGNYLPINSIIIGEFKNYLSTLDNEEKFNMLTLIKFFDGNKTSSFDDYINVKSFKKRFFSVLRDSEVDENEVPQIVMQNTYLSFIKLLIEISKDSKFKGIFKISDDISISKGNLLHNQTIIGNDNINNFILTNIINIYPFDINKLQDYINFFNGLNIFYIDIDTEELSNKNTEEYEDNNSDYSQLEDADPEELRRKLNTIAAVAESDKRFNTFTINHFENREDTIYGKIVNENKLLKKRRKDKELFLKRGLYEKNNKERIGKSILKIEKINKNSTTEKDLVTVDDYREYLGKLYDKNYSNFDWLYNEGILEFLTFFDLVNGLWIINEDYDYFFSINNPADRKIEILKLFNEQKFKDKLITHGKDIFIYSRTQVNVSIKYSDIKTNTHIGFLHDLTYLFNESRSISVFDPDLFNKPYTKRFFEERIFVSESMNKKIEIIDNLKNENTVSVTYEISSTNTAKINTNDYNGQNRKIASLLSMMNYPSENYFQLIAEKSPIGESYKFKLSSFGGEDISNIFTEFTNNGTIVDYVYNIILPQIKGNNLNEKMKKLYNFLITENYIEDTTKEVNEFQSVFSFFESSNQTAIDEFENDFIYNYLWGTVSDRGVINNIFLVKVLNPFHRKINKSNNTDDDTITYKAINRYLSIDNSSVFDLENSDKINENGEIVSLYRKENQDKNIKGTVFDDNILLNLQNRKKLLLSFTNTLFSRFVNLFKGTDNIFLTKDSLNSSEDISKMMRAIFKFKLHKPSVFGKEESILANIAKSIDIYKTPIIGRIDVVYASKSNQRKIFLTVKDGNNIKIVKLYDETLDTNDKDKFELFILKPSYTKDGETTYIINDKSKSKINENDLKELFKHVKLTLSSSNLDLPKSTELHDDFKNDKYEITTYGDLVKLVTKSFINGIENTFFINPILQIGKEITSEKDIINKKSITVDIPTVTPIISESPITLNDFFYNEILKTLTEDDILSEVGNTYEEEIINYFNEINESIRNISIYSNTTFIKSSIIEFINDDSVNHTFSIKKLYKELLEIQNKKSMEYLEKAHEFIIALINKIKTPTHKENLLRRNCPFF